MNIHLDASSAHYVWMALGWALCAAAAHLALAWFELLPGSALRSRLRRLLGAGASLATGIWALHGISASLDPTVPVVDFHIGVELAVWLLSAGVTVASLSLCNTREPALPQRMSAAVVLALGVVVSQLLGVLTSSRALALSDWQVGRVIAAVLVCGAAFTASFALAHLLRSRERPARSQGRLAAGVLMGAGVLASQWLVLHGAAVHFPLSSSGGATDDGATLAALALLGASAVLTLLRQLLLKRLRARAASAASESASSHDPLTGLPTRQLFEGALTQAVNQADATQQRLALLLINLDSFKPINQSFGHLGGDQVLREVAARLRALSQPHMTARMAGDEFLMLLRGDPQPRDASALAVEVIKALGAPFTVDGRKAALSCSIGVAVYPEHGAKSTMISHAHAAMGAAKAAGGASHAFFEQRMIKGMREDVELLRDLRVALENRQLELYYQPKIHAPSGEITGAEALLRWHHPQRGMISPALFIPIAERYGLISAIGRWVIDEACRQTRAWRDSGLRMRVAVNLSVHQLRQPDLAEWITEALQRHQVNPDLITCEVTESSAMDDTEVTMRVLGQLDRVGVHISIDDFGTGHSSLAYLRKLPADELKIDRSFVMDLETSEYARKVAVAVINLAKALNLKVVAEGVETEGQNRILREFGCDQLQGYLFAKPMSAKALALWAMDDVGPRAMNFRSSLFQETAPAPVI